MKVLVVGDGMIEANKIAKAARKLKIKDLKIKAINWIMDKVELQRIRRKIEKYGPSMKYLTNEIINEAIDQKLF